MSTEKRTRDNYHFDFVFCSAISFTTVNNDNCLVENHIPHENGFISSQNNYFDLMLDVTLKVAPSTQKLMMMIQLV